MNTYAKIIRGLLILIPPLNSSSQSHSSEVSESQENTTPSTPQNELAFSTKRARNRSLEKVNNHLPHSSQKKIK